MNNFFSERKNNMPQPAAKIIKLIVLSVLLGLVVTALSSCMIWVETPAELDNLQFGKPLSLIHISPSLYSRISPGWQFSVLQILSRVENLTPFALPFFRTEILTKEIPTFSASSETLIFRFASITSTLIIIIATFPSSYDGFVFLFYFGSLIDQMR